MILAMAVLPESISIYIYLKFSLASDNVVLSIAPYLAIVVFGTVEDFDDAIIKFLNYWVFCDFVTKFQRVFLIFIFILFYFYFFLIKLPVQGESMLMWIFLYFS